MPASADLRSLLAGPVLDVAPRLLGAHLTHAGVTLRLTEVEAYAGSDDPGSHAYRGRTPRTEVMFGPAAHLYAYFTYGMHTCANVVTGPDGEASAVLLRAGEVVEGVDLVRSRRPGVPDRDLARGPARLCRAMQLTLAQNGADLVSGPVQLALAPVALDPGAVSTGPRVGLRGAPERPWRFWETSNRTVSTYRPAAPLRPRRSGPSGPHPL